MHEIDFQPIGKRVAVKPGSSLLMAAQQAGITLTAVCGGEGNCGQCRVQILEGLVTPPTLDEKFTLTELELRNGMRLACCTIPQGAVKVELPVSSLLTQARLQTENTLRQVEVVPLVTRHDIEIPPPSMDDPRPDLERIAQAVEGVGKPATLTAEPAVIRQISPAARAYGWQMSVYVQNGEIVGIAPYGSPPIGLAVDLGTTKIAAFLLNLETGEELAAAGTLNPQIGYGEDLISRLNYAHRHEQGAQVLAEKVQSALAELLEDLLQQAGVQPEQVAECCIVGNTAMTHLLLELPTRQLATAPYVASVLDPLDVKVRSLGLSTAPGAYVHIVPGIGGFVGGDHVAAILASDMDNAEQVTIGIDIGTNTEIALAKAGKVYMSSVSCASGPAFEGAHISDGMRAAAGAIEAVRLTDSGIQLKTIENAAPVGMCGSGIVDAVAELRRNHIINYRGRFKKDDPGVRQNHHGSEVLLAPAKESGSGRDVVITQEDVNQIQLAKGAIRAGLDVLLAVTNTTPEEVKHIVIAGAFGSFLDIQSALDIGLLPDYAGTTYRQVGNAAAAGAKWALVSRAERDRTRQIAATTTYVELTTYPGFSRFFALGMLFPPDDELSNHKE